MREFVNKARSTMERDLNFSSPESLAVELDQAKVSRVCLRVYFRPRIPVILMTFY